MKIGGDSGMEKVLTYKFVVKLRCPQVRGKRDIFVQMRQLFSEGMELPYGHLYKP